MFVAKPLIQHKKKLKYSTLYQPMYSYLKCLFLQTVPKIKRNLKNQNLKEMAGGFNLNLEVK